MAFGGLRPAGVVVGVDEQIEVSAQLFVVAVVVTLDRRPLDRPVYLPDLAAPREDGLPDHLLILEAPRVVRFGQAVLDLVCVADHVEAALPRIDRVTVAGLLGELDAIIGQKRVQPVRKRRSALPPGTGRRCARSLRHKGARRQI